MVVVLEVLDLVGRWWALEDDGGGPSAALGLVDDVRQLINDGADVNEVNAQGRAAVHLAAANGAVGVLGQLKQRGAELNARTGLIGNTAYHLAAMDGRLDSLDMLYESGVDVSIKNHNGNAALHLAVLENREEVVRKLIKDHGCDVDLRSDLGVTALDIARMLGHESIVSALEDHGAADAYIDQGIKPLMQ